MNEELLAAIPEYSATREVLVFKYGETVKDVVIAEEPLEIFVAANNRVELVATTMRTSGEDHVLAVGHLFSEGIVGSIMAISRPEQCSDANNQVIVEFDQWPVEEGKSMQRLGVQSSSCGLCGKTSLDSFFQQDYSMRPVSARRWSYADIEFISESIHDEQPRFQQTGGSHCVWLYDAANQLVISFEDVGRHNALDKLLGWVRLHQLNGIENMTLVLSSRLSYELVHKAALVGLWVVLSIGAPSSLAVELANKLEMTAIGFLKNKRFNIYTNRIALVYEK
ncbi:MAG: formate dehydrogenase accessory sulfurtransferase FdhD [Akkermansiaceae bacterium]